MNHSAQQTTPLTGVAQTLFFPLLGRALLSKYAWSPVRDEYACRLIESTNYDFTPLSQTIGDIALFFMARAYQFDKICKRYLKQHPKNTIVNLGCGLETAFYRVDDGELTWIDIDLPEVIELKKSLLPPNDRVHYLAKSILDFSWMDEVKQHAAGPILFLAGGFFIYFTPEQVKTILTTLAKTFPHSELIFDVVSEKALAPSNKKLRESGMSDACIQWSLDDAKILETWSKHIQLLSQFHYFKTIKTKPGIPLVTRLKLFFYDLADKPSCVHLSFREGLTGETRGQVF